MAQSVRLARDQHECLDSILRNCVRLTSLIDDLLDLARIESGRIRLKREELDVSRLLAECVSDFGPQFRTKNQSLVLLAHEGGVPTVLGDWSKIQQVVVNLVGNAHKFTQDGGQVVVKAAPGIGNVTVSVADNGPGIESTQLDTIFDAFTQIDREEGPGLRGTGLGLTITRKLVQFHEGDISVFSGPDQGTTFSFTLPIYDVATEQKAFLIDQARCATKGMVGTVIAVAPRTLAGGAIESNLPAIKSRCDLAISRAKACNSISDDGVFLYFLEAPTPVSRNSILRLLESVSMTDEKLFCERDTLMDAEQADYRAFGQPDLVVAHLCMSDAIVARAGGALPPGRIFAFAAFHTDQWRKTGRGVALRLRGRSGSGRAGRCGAPRRAPRGGDRDRPLLLGGRGSGAGGRPPPPMGGGRALGGLGALRRRGRVGPSPGAGSSCWPGAMARDAS